MANHQPECLALVPRMREKIAAGVQDKFAHGSVPVQLLSQLSTKTGKSRAVQGKMARGLALGEVGTPSGLRQLVGKVAVTAFIGATDCRR
jgi:long-subunit acyl-CoA synthetase (AMP-forming)